MQPEKEFHTQGQQQGQRSNQGHAMTLHSYVPQPMSLLSCNFPHLMVSEIQRGETSPPALPRTPWVKTIPTQPSKVVR